MTTADDDSNTTTPDSTASAEDVAGPVITAVAPERAATTGGTEVTVSGRNFQEGCTVSLLDEHSPAVSFDGDHAVRFIAPPHETPESGTLHVQNPDGLRSEPAVAFAYVAPRAPQIDGLTQSDGTTAGGKRITISGRDFQPGCAVRFGAGSATIVRADESTLVVDIPPAATPGPVDVVVANPDGQRATASGAFNYELPPAPPKLISIQPTAGYCAGGTSVAIAGDNFDDRTVLRIGEVQASIERVTATELVAQTPPHEEPGPVALEVINRLGVPIRLENAFRYERRPPPIIEDVEPRVGSTLGGTRVVIEGLNLGTDMKVRIGRQRAKLLRARGTTVLEIVTPLRRSGGLVDLEVIGPDGNAVVAKKAFKYDPHPAPKISSVDPDRCSTAGGTKLTIHGENFAEGAVVLIGRKPVEPVKRVDDATLELDAPPGKHGKMMDVEVRNVDGAKGLGYRAFAYDQRYE